MSHSILDYLSDESVTPITVFRDLDAKKPSYGHFTLKQLEDLFATSLYSDDKGNVPLFNGTTFKSNNRQLGNAIQTSLLIFDLDGKNYNYQPEDIKFLFDKHKYFAYETHSSDPKFKDYRWRVVIPLSVPIRTDEYTNLWTHLVEKKRLDCDHATKAMNAIFYLPEHSTDVKPLFITNDKSLLNPDRYLNKNSVKKENRVLLNTDIRLSEKIDLMTDASGVSVCGFELPNIPEGQKKFTLDEIKSLANNTAVGLSLARLVGIDVDSCSIRKGVKLTSKALHSVLPWHDKDDHPSTGIMVKEQGEYPGKVVLRSFKSEDQSKPLFDLHYIYACQQVGKQIPLEKWTKSASLVWLSRALIDAGIITPKRFIISTKGKSLEEGSTSLLRSLEKLSEARSALNYYDEAEVAFSYSFAEIWTGITRQTASKHFKILVAEGVISQVGVKTARQTINGFVFNETLIRKTKIEVDALQNNYKDRMIQFRPEDDFYNDVRVKGDDNGFKSYMNKGKNLANNSVLCVDTR